MRTGADGLPILFLFPPSPLVTTFQEHVGTAFLGTVLLDAGISSEQYVPEANPSMAGLLADIARLRPRVLGLTVYDSNLDSCRAITRAVKRALPDVVLAGGGPACTFSPTEIMETLPLDFCVRGAAEGTIGEIVGRLADNDPSARSLSKMLGDIENLVIREGRDLVATVTSDLSSFPRRYFQTLDDIPSPYQRGLIRHPETGYMTARGCSQHCTYCSFAEISTRRVAFHGVDRVVEDLRVLDRLCRGREAVQIPISDDAFTQNKARAHQICEEIVRAGLRLRLACMTRADHVDAELLSAMKAAGFESVGFGLESASPEVLRRIGKVTRPDSPADLGRERDFLAKVREGVDAAKALGLETYVSIIGGLPGETEEDLRTTLHFVDGLGLTQYEHNLLYVWPGTPLWQTHDRYGISVSRAFHGPLYRTRHAYDAAAVGRLAYSSSADFAREEARLVADVLCGRKPPSSVAGDGMVSGVVLHGVRLDDALLSWLAGFLSIMGELVLLDTGEELTEAWLAETKGRLAAHGIVATPRLMRREPGGRDVLLVRGNFGDYTFHLNGRFVDESGRHGIVRREDGGWEVSVGRPPEPETDSAWLDALMRLPAGETPNQLADTCRWWRGKPRCAELKTIHVFADGTVRACWHGPELGRVGDSPEKIFEVARARTRLKLIPQARPLCPLRIASGLLLDEELSLAIERHEIAAMEAWDQPEASAAGT